MADTAISVPMDDSTRESFERVCEREGISMSEAVNVFARAVASEDRLPFLDPMEPFYRKSHAAYLQRSLRELEEGLASRRESLDD
ncbi:MAG: type II toxin-antitoxin system RelB/DinJ family antitoxin [Bifidobacterium sp.]|nr:type II toxin-antitoxin system RelB/DinJ family antitoxin [Bifidobacterium sp.]